MMLRVVPDMCIIEETVDYIALPNYYPLHAKYKTLAKNINILKIVSPLFKVIIDRWLNKIKERTYKSEYQNLDYKLALAFLKLM